MRSDLKPYPVYKNSDVEWLGQVPVHWETRRLKLAFSKITGGSTPSSSEAAYWDGDIVWVTPADVSRSTRLYTSLRQITQDGLLSCSTELAPAGSIIVTSRAPVGNVAIAETELCTNQGCKTLVATPDVVDPMFGFNILTTIKDELQSLAVGTTFTEISTDRIGSVRMPLPPLLEQAAIVRYLDYMDRRIQRYIRAKQKLIKLLEEQKQAIIHQAVTGQIDVRTGKPYLTYKPSGVEWLGDVPEHWELSRLVKFITLQRGFDITKDQQRDGSIPVVSSGGISSYHDTATGEGPGVIVGRKGTAGAVHYIETDYWAHDTTLWVSDFKGSCPRYVFYVLIELDLKRFDTGSANPTLNRNIIHPEPIAFPPPTEQTLIAVYLDAILDANARAIDSALRVILLLKEYRTRLISDVVTGKLDVREAAANLPEELKEELPEDQEQEEEDDKDLADEEHIEDEP